jgi:hypothetical protein
LARAILSRCHKATSAFATYNGFRVTVFGSIWHCFKRWGKFWRNINVSIGPFQRCPAIVGFFRYHFNDNFGALRRANNIGHRWQCLQFI